VKSKLRKVEQML